MRVLIQFPYNTHWKTKAKFMKQFNCVYATDTENKGVVSDCIFKGGAIDFLDMYTKLSEYFPATYIDFWELRKANLTHSYFEIHNKVDYAVIPRRVYQGNISIE